MKIACSGGRLRVAPRAVPRNGAEHGVAAMLARMPEKKVPVKPCFWVS